jgi:2-dehydropantoate 2-reductase
MGNADVSAPAVTRKELQSLFDLVLLSCKAYDLPDAMDSFAPAVGAKTAILPLLNGLRHIELLEERFGPPAVLGGQCLISATLDGDGRVLHLNDSHALSFGERDGSASERVLAIASAFTGTKFEACLSKAILQEMWEKWVFIAAAAGIACLMRAPIGDIVTAGAADLAAALLDECAAIASQQKFPPREAALQQSRAMLTAAGSGLTPSMLRDIERGARTEADHVLGDLLRRGGEPEGSHSLLRIAFAHLNVYEARRARTNAASDGASRT